MGDSGYGQHDAGWLSFYDYFREAVGLEAQTSQLAGIWAQARNAGWYLPHAHICWVSERHQLLARNAQGRLHSLTGPAVLYPDGWAIYAVNGVRVPAWLIESPQEITPAKCDAEPNAEIRRVMIELYGAARYLTDGGATLVQSDAYGKLWRRELEGDEALTMVEVVNATPEPTGEYKTYWLRVPSGMQSAREAVAWTFGKTAAEYQPIFES